MGESSPVSTEGLLAHICEGTPAAPLSIGLQEFSACSVRMSELVESYERIRFDASPDRQSVSRAVDCLLSTGFSGHAVKVLAKSAWAANRYSGPVEGAGFLEAAAKIALEEESLLLAQDLMDQAMMMNDGSVMPELERTTGDIHLASGSFDEAASVYSHLSERFDREGLRTGPCLSLRLARAYVGIAGTTTDSRRRDFFLNRADEFLDQCFALGDRDEKVCSATLRASVQLNNRQYEEAVRTLDGVDPARCGLAPSIEYCRARASLASVTGSRSDLFEWCGRGISLAGSPGAPLHAVSISRTIVDFLSLSQSLEPSSQARSVFFSEAGRAFLESAAEISDRRDEYIGNSHSPSVRDLALAAAVRIVEPGTLEQGALRERLGVGSLLHDLGKLFIPWRVINGIEPVGVEERALFRRHPVMGADLCRAVGIDSAARMVQEHHETCDGSGYPEGTEDLSQWGRLLCAANEFVNSTSDCRRTLSAALPVQDALAVLEADSGRRYDPLVVSGIRRALESPG